MDPVFVTVRYPVRPIELVMQTDPAKKYSETLERNAILSVLHYFIIIVKLR